MLIHIERTTLIQCYQGLFYTLGDLNYGKTNGFIWFESLFVIFRTIFKRNKEEFKLIFKELLQLKYHDYTIRATFTRYTPRLHD